MSALTLELREIPPTRIDGSAFTPEGLAGQTANQVSRLPLWVGNRQVETGELFAVRGKPGDTLIFRGDCDRLDWIGHRLARGRIRVEGDVGAYLGRLMSGGAIETTGDAGLFAGSGLSGGILRIGGNAGDFLGAAIPGERQGLRGGRIEVLGSAGDRVGDRQRRGQILIAGNAGAYCGSRLVAGTILVLGAAGAGTGFAMRRGTLLLGAEPRLPPTFNPNGIQDLGFLALLARDLASAGGPFAPLAGRGTRVRRWLGDLSCGGQGEVLVWA